MRRQLTYQRSPHLTRCTCDSRKPNYQESPEECVAASAGNVRSFNFTQLSRHRRQDINKNGKVKKFSTHLSTTREMFIHLSRNYTYYVLFVNYPTDKEEHGKNTLWSLTGSLRKETSAFLFIQLVSISVSKLLPSTGCCLLLLHSYKSFFLEIKIFPK